MTVIAKMADGKIVQVVKVADRVGFSDDRGWVCICTDFGVRDYRKSGFKWVHSSTPFTWVRNFNFA